ncbi:MAG: SGNH/GDSL hydrolase family protein [Pirellulaceae bacterium]
MNSSSLRYAAALSLLLIATLSHADELPGLKGHKRVVFLGDSITYSGQYIDVLGAYLAVKYPQQKCELINLGLPSETVSGLSEPGHAGGAFPRPDVHERLGRVLEKVKPDLVVACYGMNCGMYYPLSEERMEKFQSGILRLREAAEKAGAKVLHITPPVFDAEPIKARTLPAGQAEYRQPYVGYNEVLDAYTKWLLDQRAKGWQVVDMHSPMNAYIAEQRKSDPKFTLAADGVHMNGNGHWLAAQQLLLGLWAPEEEIKKAKSADELLKGYPHGLEVLKLTEQKNHILRDAWLSTAGHKRPGIAPGLPVEEAEKKAAEISSRIQELVK